MEGWVWVGGRARVGELRFIRFGLGLEGPEVPPSYPGVVVGGSSLGQGRLTVRRAFARAGAEAGGPGALGPWNIATPGGSEVLDKALGHVGL